MIRAHLSGVNANSLEYQQADLSLSENSVRRSLFIGTALTQGGRAVLTFQFKSSQLLNIKLNI